MPTDTSKGYVVFFDDFLGDLIDDAYGTTADGSATVAIPTPDTAVVDGFVRLTTHNSDNNMAEIAHSLSYRAQDGIMSFEARVKMSAITTTAMSIGFNDDQLEASNTLPVELSGTTFTSNAATFVGFVFDTDATNDNWHAFAVDDCTDTTTPIACLNTGVAPVADTYQTLKVVVHDRGACYMAYAEFFINCELQASIENAIDRDATLVPHIAAEARAACASRNHDVDYIEVMKSRA